MSASATGNTRTRAKGPLRFHPRRRAPFHRLPFIGLDARGRVSFWDVPATGGYHGGCKTGAALATLYLRFLREREVAGALPGGNLSTLPLLVLGMAGLPPASVDSAKKGQVVGFCTELDYWLRAAVLHMGESLDRVDAEALLRTANAGLAFVEPVRVVADKAGDEGVQS